MKPKPFKFILVFSLAFSLACQFLTRPLSNATEPAAAEPAATEAPSPSPTPEDTSAPLSGLIYSIYDSETTANAVWQFDANNAARLLLPNHYVGMLSPDEAQVVYYDYPWGFRETPPCVSIADVKTGNPKSLACSSGMEGDLTPTILGWDPLNPDIVLAILKQTGGGMGGSEGYFGTISLADGSTTILDPDHPIESGEAAVSPDGTMVAYGRGIYHLDSGYQEFDPSFYGIDKAFHAENPSWSPDGKKIAWGLVKEIEGDSVQVSLGVFDLEQKTATLILPSFSPQRIWEIASVATPAAIWSPDGQWLAVNVETDSNDSNAPIQSGWEIVSIDGKTLRDVDGNFDSWSPDGQWFAHFDWEPGGGDGMILSVSRADGSETHALGDIKAYSSAQWNPNMRFLAFVGRDQIIRYVEIGIWQVNEFKLENIEAQMEVGLADWIIPIEPWIK